MVDTDSLAFALSVAAIPFFIIGFIGNVLVIRIVHKTRQMHTTTNYLLANLAVSDVITILLVMPYFYISDLVGDQSGELGMDACKFSAITSIVAMVSSFTLTVLAVERYHALLKPLRTGLRLKKDNINRAIALIWIASVLFSLPLFYFYEQNKTFSKCFPRTNTASKLYMIIYYLFITYLPLAVFVYCYGSLIKGLYFTNTICSADTEEDRSSEKKKLVVTFILATAGFVIGYGTTTVFNTIVILGGGEQMASYTDISSVLLFVFLCSLCLNPMLYAFRSTNFQEGFKRIIFCRRPTPEAIQLEWLFSQQQSLISRICYLRNNNN